MAGGNKSIMEDIEITPSNSQRIKSKAKVRIQNKMLDPSIYQFEEQVEEHEFLRDEDLQLPTRQRPQKTLSQFFSRFQSQKTDFASQLALKVIKNQNEEDRMEITAPAQVSGFIIKKRSMDPRQMLMENLRAQINQRKTQDLTQDMIFNKSVSELLGVKPKQQQEEEEDSDYEPEEAQIEEEMSASSSDAEDKISDGKKTPESPQFYHETDLSTQCTMNEYNQSQDFSKIEFFRTKSIELQIPETPTTIDTEKFYKQSNFERIRTFIDNEAELGSDDEEHDHVVRKVSDDEEEDDGELEEIIDRGNVKARKRKLATKHLGDILLQDEQNLQRVINGEFKRQRSYEDYMEDQSDLAVKRQKIMSERAQNHNQRAARGFTGNHRNNIIEEDWEEVRVTQSVRRRARPIEPLLDESSMKFLEMITKPEITYSKKSLIR